jgi:hypothetical protein
MRVSLLVRSQLGSGVSRQMQRDGLAMPLGVRLSLWTMGRGVLMRFTFIFTRELKRLTDLIARVSVGTRLD